MKAHLQETGSKLDPQRGMVLITTLVAITALMALGMVISTRNSGTSQHVRRDYQLERVFHVAEGGADVGQAWLLGLLATNASPTQTQLDALTPPALTGFAFEELRINKLPLRPDVLITHGPNAGLTADIQPYEIVSHARNDRSTADQTVRVTINQELIGLYQYGIYYGGDLEMFPSFPLDYIGRIHTNGNLYVGSQNTVDLNTQVTVAGHIYRTPKDPTILLNGKARFPDSQGNWHDLSYDSTDPDWVQKSNADWDGNVQDSAHGVTPLPYPIPTTANAHDIIERPVLGESQEMVQKKYYYKAGLRIMDGAATDSAGNMVSLPAGVLTSSSVYDYREQHAMEMRNLDIGALIAANLVPPNGVIYISYTHTAAAVRIKNASSLPEGGLVIATDNPCYVWSHYNTVNKQPSSIMCDAFNVYSSIWADSHADENLNQRIAAATTVNSCVVTGNQSTETGAYGGGAENIIRLHEKWVGHELTFRGSIVCMWESEQATGDFLNASYVEAQRDWAFDPDLLDPEFWPDELAISHIVRGQWRAD